MHNRAHARATHALRRARARLAGRGEDGFVLLESIIAITLITVIMCAVGAEYVSGLALTSRQRAVQTATQIADSALEQARALRPSDLVTGRSITAVTTQLSTGNSLNAIAPWLQNMDPVSDSTLPAASTAGVLATIPTCDPRPASSATTCQQKPGATTYTVAQFLGSCWLAPSSSAANCLPALQKTSTSVQYLRLVVSIGWTSSTCPSAGCYYLTSTLINGDTDPTFKANQPIPAAPVVSSPGDQTNDIGDTVSLQLSTQLGTGVPAFTWDITSGSLPRGLSMSSSGLISGTATGPVSSSGVTVRVTDGYGRQDTATFNWSIYNAPTITAPADQVTALNAPVNLAITTTCQNTPCTYTLNNAPTGLAISNIGVITGAPTSAGTSRTSITVTDAGNVSATTATFNWTVLSAAPVCSTVQTVALPNGSFEAPAVPAGGGTNKPNGAGGMYWRTNGVNGQIEYWANGGNSTTLNNNIAITAQQGTQWVEVNGASMDTLSQDLTTTPGQVLQWSIWHRARGAAGVPTSNTDSVQVQIGSTLSQTPQVPTGATSATISDGPLAGWVNYSGVYTVPAGQTTTRFQVAAVGTASGAAGYGNFLDNVTVTGAPCLTAAAVAQTSTVNTAITPLQLSASQGSGSYTWSGGASLPAGLTLSSSGLITGTPTATGAKQVALTLTDTTTGYQQSVNFTWTVTGSPSITTPANQTTTVGANVSVAVSASCPNTPCTYTLSGAPAGLSINASTGVISGTPTTVGTSNSTRVTVTDRSGANATTSVFTWVVKAAPTVNSPGNQSTTVGVAVNLSVTSSCGYAPCAYTLTNAPSGVSINANTGVITGSPTTPGTNSGVYVTITDAAGVAANTSTFTWRVYAAPTVSSPGNQASTVNTALITPVSSTCANTPCSYSLSGAPTGVTINNSTGTISGTPTATGTSNPVTVTITDNGGATATTSAFTWTVYARPTVTAPANQTTPNNATVGLTLSTTCPDAPCAYTLNGGPAGLSVSNSGVISGTVTSAPQTFSGVTIGVVDSAGATATSAAFTWAVTTPLAGRWPFDESSGATAADSSGNGHAATLAGSTTRTATAAQGAYAWTLNGTSTVATASGTVLNTANSFTVGAWVKLSSATGTQTFVSKDGTNVSAFALQYISGTGFAFSRPASDSTSATITRSVAASSTVATGQWYYLTGVYDATARTLTLYVNGVRQGSPVSYTTGWNGTGSFVMGRGKSTSATNWASGVLDDVRAYSSALTSDAAVQLAQAGDWALDDGSGTTADDSSLNNVDGTLSGGATWTTSSIVGSGAVQFNGSSGAITSNSTVLDTSQSFTVTAWAKSDNASATGAVASVDGVNVSAFALLESGGKWTLARAASDSTSAAVTLVQASANIVAGQWYQLAAVYDSAAGTLALYVNGVRQGTPVSYTTGWKATNKFVIGRGKNSAAATYYFPGAIDDVHAYQFALDQAGVTTVTTQTPAAPSTPSATAAAASASVSWTAPADVAGSPVTGYVVTPYLDGVAQTALTYNSTATTQTVSGLTTGGSYAFTVAAKNANGTSTASGRSNTVLPS